MESFAIPVRNEKSVKIDKRFLSSDKGNILPQIASISAAPNKKALYKH